MTINAIQQQALITTDQQPVQSWLGKAKERVSSAWDQARVFFAMDADYESDVDEHSYSIANEMNFRRNKPFEIETSPAAVEEIRDAEDGPPEFDENESHSIQNQFRMYGAAPEITSGIEEKLRDYKGEINHLASTVVFLTAVLLAGGGIIRAWQTEPDPNLVLSFLFAKLERIAKTRLDIPQTQLLRAVGAIMRYNATDRLVAFSHDELGLPPDFLMGTISMPGYSVLPVLMGKDFDAAAAGLPSPFTKEETMGAVAHEITHLLQANPRVPYVSERGADLLPTQFQVLGRGLWAGLKRMAVADPGNIDFDNGIHPPLRERIQYVLKAICQNFPVENQDICMGERNVCPI